MLVYITVTIHDILENIVWVRNAWSML